MPLNFNDLRNKYRFVDGASGWNFDDSIRGSNEVLCDPASAEVAECLVIGMELTAAGAAKIGAAPGASQVSLTQLMGPAGFNKDLNDPAIPLVKNVGFMGGDILLGGTGSDTLEGKKGDDLIDGDRWLNVQLRAAMNDGSVKFANSLGELVDDIFADPQRLNPGNITIVKTIVTPTVPPADCNAPAGTPKLNCDTAVFSFPAADYDIQRDGPRVIVTHIPAVAADVPASDGVDTLLNIEQLRFANGVIVNVANGGGATTVAVPNVVGLSQAAATSTLTGADFVVTSTNANSPTVAIGNVISQNPAAGTLRPFGSSVNVVIAVGALVPNVVGLTQGAASTALTGAGLAVGSITTVNSAAAAGTVLSQAPPAGTSQAPGTGIALTVSLGPANVIVPNVVGQAQAVGTTNLTTAGLVIGTVTTQSSTTVASGNIISTSPAAGVSVAPGSAVNLVVSTGAPAAPGLVAAFGFDEVSGVTAINTANNAFNGTIRQAVRVAGKIGKALSFDGVDDWVTITDTAASPLDLTTGMTLEAWVNPAAASGWETVVMKERGNAGEGLLAYVLYARDGAPRAGGEPLRLHPRQPGGLDHGPRGARHRRHPAERVDAPRRHLRRGEPALLRQRRAGRHDPRALAASTSPTARCASAATTRRRRDRASSSAASSTKCASTTARSRRLRSRPT